jgi:hypothetical protein
MDCAYDEAIDPKRTQLVGGKGHVIALAWTQNKTSVEVGNYREPMRLDRIIAHDVNPDTLPQRNIHDGPRTTVEHTTVETFSHPFACHHHNEISRG